MFYVLNKKRVLFLHLMNSINQNVKKRGFGKAKNLKKKKRVAQILTCIRWAYYSDHVPCYNRMHNVLQIENYNQLETFNWQTQL